MLKDERDYNRLLAKRDILKMIFDMRYYIFLKRQRDTEQVRIGCASKVLEEYMDLPSRLKKIVNSLNRKEYTLDIIEDAKNALYNGVGRLYSSYKKDIPHLRELETSILALELACPNIKPLAIEVMNFLLDVSDDYVDKSTLGNELENLLRILPYWSIEKERSYLSNKCPYYSWYSALFFENPTVPCSRISEDLDELLRSFLDDENPFRNNFAIKAVSAYFERYQHFYIATDTLRELLSSKTKLPKDVYVIFKKRRSVLPFDMDSLLSSLLATQKNIEGVLNIGSISKLFTYFYSFLSKSECFELFIRLLDDEPNGIDLIDQLEVFISSTYGEEHGDDFLATYFRLAAQKKTKDQVLTINPAT